MLEVPVPEAEPRFAPDQLCEFTQLVDEAWSVAVIAAPARSTGGRATCQLVLEPALNPLPARSVTVTGYFEVVPVHAPTMPLPLIARPIPRAPVSEKAEPVPPEL